MIAQPFTPAELLAATQSSQLAELMPVRGMRGFRVWNASEYWFDVTNGREEKVTLIAPWSFVTGSFEEELESVNVEKATDLMAFPITSQISFRFQIQFTKKEQPVAIAALLVT